VGYAPGSSASSTGWRSSTLRRHLKRQRQAQGPPEPGVRFMALKVNGTSEPAAPQAAVETLEVKLASGRRIGVAPGFDEATLGRLVRALESL
jgi:hypothetical protein